MNHVRKPERIRALLIVNPRAGGARHAVELNEAEAYLMSEGWEVRRAYSQYPDHPRVLARQAVERGFNVVLMAGGDGSVGQVADGLAGTEVALGIIPAGTGNILARDLGLPVPSPWQPHVFQDVAQVLARARWQRVDLGMITDGQGTSRHFINWCGTGLDAAITALVEPHPEEKRRWGRAAYVLPAVRAALQYRPVHWSITADGEHLEGMCYLVVVNNIQLYGGIVRLAPDACMDDGVLDLTLIGGRDLEDLLAEASRLAVFRRPVGANMLVRRVRRVHIESVIPQRVHTDGDPVTMTPVEVVVRPQCLTLLVPGGTRFPGHLFQDTHAHNRQVSMLSRWLTPQKIAPPAGDPEGCPPNSAVSSLGVQPVSGR